MYDVIGWDQGDYTTLETFAYLGNAVTYARETVTIHGWMAAIVKHAGTGQILFDTDTEG